MKNNGVMTLIGFVVFFLGFISLVLFLVGLRLSFLNFLYSFGNGFAFLMSLVMIFGGFIIIYISKTDIK